jgi:hypothetical protein
VLHLQWRRTGPKTDIRGSCDFCRDRGVFSRRGFGNCADAVVTTARSCMRGSSTFFCAMIVLGVSSACGGSSTAPARCDGTATTASFADGESISGVVTIVNFTTDPSLVEMLAVAIPGDPDFTIAFSISGSTGIFERRRGAPPTPVSACHLAEGQRVELPISILTNGFRDYIPISGNDPAPPVPPAIDQIVIVR